MNEVMRVIVKTLLVISFSAAALTVISAILMNRLPDQPDREELNDNIWDRIFSISLVIAAVGLIAGMVVSVVALICLELKL